MSSIRTIHDINSKICLFLGSLLNLLLIWMVFKKTPKEMKVYSKIVLQTCICDLILLGLSDIIQPILFVSRSVAMVLENGISVQFPHPYNIVVYDLWMYSSYFTVIGICVQFIYRYLVLCRQHNLGTLCYFGILSGAMIFEVVLLAFFAWIGYPPNGQTFLDDLQVLRILNQSMSSESSRNFDLRIVLHGDKADYRWILWNSVFVLTNVLCYCIIVFCGTKMVAYIRKNLKMGNLKKRAATINRQMTMNMIIQASIPMVDLLVFSMASYASMADQQEDWLIGATMLLGPIINWIPVVNPLVTLITVAPYRKTILRVGDSLPDETQTNPQQNAKKGPRSGSLKQNGQIVPIGQNGQRISVAWTNTARRASQYK